MTTKIFLAIFLPIAAAVAALTFYISKDQEEATQTVVEAPSVDEKPQAAQEETRAPVQSSAIEQEKSTEDNESALASVPGFGHAVDADEARFSEEELTREKLIADCMKANGFDYTPAPSVVIDDAAASDPEAFERLLMEAANDPNEQYVRSLSADMRKTYYLTLTGMEDPNDPEGQAQELAQHSDSCVNRAFREIPGVYAKRHLLSDAVDKMERDIANDERIVRANEQWSECMSNAGYAFEQPADVHRQADADMATLYEKQTSAEKIASSAARVSNTLERMEICIEKSKLTEIRKQVRVEHENRFFAAHREQLVNN